MAVACSAPPRSGVVPPDAGGDAGSPAAVPSGLVVNMDLTERLLERDVRTAMIEGRVEASAGIGSITVAGEDVLPEPNDSDIITIVLRI